jgi:predicted DCC family thiol-disulfide oxidoreductase YuxK
MSIPVVRFVFGSPGAVPMANGRAYTLVFDGACRVCNRLVGLLRRWDRERQVEVVPSQNTSVHARFPWIPAEAYQESIQLVQTASGRTWQGAGAIEQLLGILPRGGWIGWVFRIPLVGGTLDRFYRWFARNRYRLGCGEHCQYHPLRVEYEERPEELTSGAVAPLPQQQ